MLDAVYRLPRRHPLQPVDHRADRRRAAARPQPPAPLFCPAARRRHRPRRLPRASGTIYLLAVREAGAAVLAPLVSAFVDELTETAKQHRRRHPRRPARPAARPVPATRSPTSSRCPHLPALMSYAGGSGIFVVAVLQNMAQAEHRWGRDGAAMLWGAATVKIALGGLSGDELRELSELAGEYRETLTSYQRGSTGAHRADHPAATARPSPPRKSAPCPNTTAKP